MRPRSRPELIDDVRAQIAEYRLMRDRLGQPVTFQTALSRHRHMLEEAVHDTPTDTDLRDRLDLIDELCNQEGVA